MLLSTAVNGDIVWDTTVLNSSGVAQSVFNVGDSGYIDVSVNASGADLGAVGNIYQAILQLDNRTGITTSLAVESNTTPNPGDDLHASVVQQVFDLNVGAGREWGYGELFGNVTPATTSLFRLPFTITAAAAGGTFSWSIIPISTDGFAPTEWNGVLGTIGPLATDSFTVNPVAVPEPSSVLLLTGITAGLGFYHRRRKVQQAA